MYQTSLFKGLEKGYLGILDNYESLDEYFPDFVSIFQNKILPLVLQTNSFNQKLMRSAPSPFPPKVDPKDVSFVKKTVKIEWMFPDFCKYS